MRVQLKFIWLFIILIFESCIQDQPPFRPASFYAPNAIAENRAQFRKSLIEETIFKNLATPLDSVHESNWQSAFWGIELALFRNDTVFQALKRAFVNFSQRSPGFQRALLEVSFCLYPGQFQTEITAIAQSTENPKIFAMAIHYLLNGNSGISAEATRHSLDDSLLFTGKSGSSIKSVFALTSENAKKKFCLKLLKERFPDWAKHPILFLLANALQTTKKLQFQQRPPLLDLLKHPFEVGKTVVYNFQRANRNYAGLTVIKKPDGKFVRTVDGRLFQIPHLARSIANLPGYLTNGNTPQGIFSIQGLDTSKNVFIGPSPNLQLALPFEISLADYFHHSDSTDTTWTKASYQKLLPESWQDYLPIYEAFYAGAAGRTEIIAHGTTIDPAFYQGKTYFPNTPSLGCLTAKEIWSDVDGQCLVSDQIAFMNAFLSTGCQAGYLVVVELDDKPMPIVIDEILMPVLQAEEYLVKDLK